ncbi:MAG: chromosomal replication initiator protein DnaA [Planctomycetes bacterium]|nr:chromosomal replication initiator protein DnaA [Planctomycetota bacterium]
MTDDLLRENLRQLVNQRKYDLWFHTVRVVDVQPGEVVLSLGNRFLLDWIRTYYTEVLDRAVEATWGEPREWRLVVAESEQTAGGATNGELHEPLEAEASADTRPDPTPPVHVEPQRSAQDEVAWKNQSFFLHHSDVVLNDKYTFENFVVGPSNSLAHAAAYAVADAPAGSYNPLFLHGNVGLGKTHLLQAICHKAMASGRALKVLYLSSETFVNQFIVAVEKGELSQFRYRYRNVDVLLIDDIHLLANKERTQEEFFHTFNTLYHDQRQIVLSSDSPPSEIPSLRERLISRFKWGLVAEIEPPGFETRLAILRRKARDRDFLIPEDVLNYLAEHIDRNIRELEGAVTKVVGYAQLIHRTIDLDLARKALGQAGDSSATRMTGIDRILEVVCAQFDVRPSDLGGRKRTQSVAFPRQVCMYLARRLTPLSLEEIGVRIGGRDHSTVLYAVNKVRDRAATDSRFAQLMNELEAKCRA